jgi:quercetin dioxygenase-like cupin family protein
MVNVLENIPYGSENLGKRKLVDEKYLLVMQVALESGQGVPQHNANSNVHILVIRGSIDIDLEGMVTKALEGDMVRVKFGTPMRIDNSSKERATFLVIKTPHPDEMS